MNKAAEATASPRAEADTEIPLGLLAAVGDEARHSQRSLARELGIALGLTNAYLRRCVRKGLIKVAAVPANRYAYYLTPKGFAEKSRLTAQFLSNSLHFYRRARDEMDDVLNQCAERGWKRIALVGRSDLAEIAILCSLQRSIEIVGVVDGAANETRFLQIPVVRDVAMLGAVDGLLLTDMTAPQATYDALLAAGSRAVAVPRLLKVTSPEMERA